jgi:hypothetical protein
VTGCGLRHRPLSSRIANQSAIDSCAFWPVGRVVKAIHTAPVTLELAFQKLFESLGGSERCIYVVVALREQKQRRLVIA